jgi:hypothetical protein
MQNCGVYSVNDTMCILLGMHGILCHDVIDKVVRLVYTGYMGQSQCGGRQLLARTPALYMYKLNQN